jgi:DNA-binding CsgD family transcriptional regulator
MGVAEHERRSGAVLEAAAHTRGLSEFLSTTLEAIEEHVGVSAAFMLALSAPGRAYAGLLHGPQEYVIEEYFERWADAGCLASQAAQEDFLSRGWTTTEQIYERLESTRMRFVDDFLHRIHAQHELSFRLPAGTTNGYLTVMAAVAPDEPTRAALAVLIPELTGLLRERLPHGIHGALSPREREVSELVALGFSNREIGAILHVEEDTVKKHVTHALAKLHQRNRAELAVAWAIGAPLDPPLATHPERTKR